MYIISLVLSWNEMFTMNYQFISTKYYFNKYFEINWPLSCLKVNLFESGFHVNDPAWIDENEFFKVTKHNNIKSTVVATINLSDLRFVNIVLKL